MRETLVPHGRLTAFTAACLEKLGLAAAEARLVAETLVASNLRGVDSHGVVRLPHYATRLRNGTVKPRPNIAVRRTGPSAAVVEGDAGMGQLVATRAKREKEGIAVDPTTWDEINAAGGKLGLDKTTIDRLAAG